MDTTHKILRLNIDGKWTADDMALAFSHIRDLYNLRFLLQTFDEERREFRDFIYPYYAYRRLKNGARTILFHEIPLDPDDLSDLAYHVYPEEELTVQRVQYGSKGFADLGGLGEIFGHLKDLIMRYVDRRQIAIENNLKNEKLQLENDGIRIQNARLFASLRTETAEADRVEQQQRRENAQHRRIIGFVDGRQEVFMRLVDQGKLNSVEILEVGDDQTPIGIPVPQ